MYSIATRPKATIGSAEDYLEQLDLSYIWQRLAAKDYPLKRWHEDDAKQCVLLYKRFLWLHIHYPDQALVPSKDMDECWHQHILHTEQYMRDCQQLFGHYLHHSPKNKANTKQLRDAFWQTNTLYKATFGENIRVFVSSS